MRKVLIDSDAILNLISLRIIRKINYIIYQNNSIIIKVANEAFKKLLEYTRFMIKIAEVRKVIEAFIIPGDITYSLILERS